MFDNIQPGRIISLPLDWYQKMPKASNYDRFVHFIEHNNEKYL